MKMAINTPVTRAPVRSPPSRWSQDETGCQRRQHCHQTWQEHLAKGGFGGNGYAGSVVRPVSSLENTGFFPELAAYLLNHLMGGLGYGFHGHGREEECQHSADEKSYNNMRVKDVNGGEFYCLSIGNKQGQSCKGSRTDGKTFADAAVVLPTESSLSVISLTFLSRPAISRFRLHCQRWDRKRQWLR